MTRGPNLLRFNRRFLDEVQLREGFTQERIPLFQNVDELILRLAAIVGVQLIDHIVHSLNDLAEWRKALAVEERVVSEVDEDLGPPGIGLARIGERNVAALVA